MNQSQFYDRLFMGVVNSLLTATVAAVSIIAIQTKAAPPEGFYKVEEANPNSLYGNYSCSPAGYSQAGTKKWWCAKIRVSPEYESSIEIWNRERLQRERSDAKHNTSRAARRNTRTTKKTSKQRLRSVRKKRIAVQKNKITGQKNLVMRLRSKKNKLNS